MTICLNDEYILRLAMIDGKIVEYDCLSENRNAYDKKLYYYLGKGKIYGIRNHRYSQKDMDEQSEVHFFASKLKNGETPQDRVKRVQKEAKAKLGIGSKGFRYR